MKLFYLKHKVKWDYSREERLSAAFGLFYVTLFSLVFWLVLVGIYFGFKG